MLGETQSIAFANEIGIVIKHKGGGVKRKPRKGHPSAEVGSARGGKKKAYGSRHTNNNQITCERAAANLCRCKEQEGGISESSTSNHGGSRRFEVQSRTWLVFFYLPDLRWRFFVVFFSALQIASQPPKLQASTAGLILLKLWLTGKVK